MRSQMRISFCLRFPKPLGFTFAPDPHAGTSREVQLERGAYRHVFAHRKFAKRCNLIQNGENDLDFKKNPQIPKKAKTVAFSARS